MVRRLTWFASHYGHREARRVRQSSRYVGSHIQRYVAIVTHEEWTLDLAFAVAPRGAQLGEPDDGQSEVGVIPCPQCVRGSVGVHRVVGSRRHRSRGTQSMDQRWSRGWFRLFVRRRSSNAGCVVRGHPARDLQEQRSRQPLDANQPDTGSEGGFCNGDRPAEPCHPLRGCFGWCVQEHQRRGWWSSSAAGFPASDVSVSLAALAIDPLTPRILYVGTRDSRHSRAATRR